MPLTRIKASVIIDGTLGTADIADDAVTAAKIANAVNTDIATGVTKNILKIDNKKISRPAIFNKSLYIISNNSIIKLD